MSASAQRKHRKFLQRQAKKRDRDRPRHAVQVVPDRDAPWDAAPEQVRVVVERFDGYAGLRNGLRRLAHHRGEWAGIPMPVEGMRLVIEPTYPKAEGLMAIGKKDEPASEAPSHKIRNRFWSSRYKSFCYAVEENGKVDARIELPNHPIKILLDTLGAADAWGIEQESNAVHTLGQMLRHRQFKQYMLTGTFVERSERSGVLYLFRRLRPTIAFSTRTGVMKILAALCMHPIGYYEGSWAGAMTPTDDVIAHLAMMRGDEHMLWRRANQHAAYRPEAGIF